MRRRRASDLQLDSDASGRFLPWVIAVMVFLAVLALAGALSLDRAVASWQRGIEGRFTVQVADLPGQPLAPRIEAALKLLRATPGIAAAEPLGRQAVEALVAPWLGARNLTPDLPLPGLIDVRLAAGAALAARALGTRLAAVPGAAVDDPQPWLDRLVRLAGLLQALGYGIVVLIGLATLAMVVFATRAGLAAHRDVIEVLHIIGARDSYVAWQFQRHVLGLAASGALVGLAAAAVTVWLIGLFAARLDAALLPAAPLGPAQWAVLALLPVLAAALAALTARLTVLGTLKRMT